MPTQLRDKNEQRLMGAAALAPEPKIASRRQRKIVMTQEEVEGYRRIIATPEPPTEKLRSLLLARHELPRNEI